MARWRRSLDRARRSVRTACRHPPEARRRDRSRGRAWQVMTTRDSNPQRTWRDFLPIHPAANLFPTMSESELRELGEDIKKSGLLAPVILCRGELLDGRNRLDAMEM